MFFTAKYIAVTVTDIERIGTDSGPDSHYKCTSLYVRGDQFQLRLSSVIRNAESSLTILKLRYSEFLVLLIKLKTTYFLYHFSVHLNVSAQFRVSEQYNYIYVLG